MFCFAYGYKCLLPPLMALQVAQQTLVDAGFDWSALQALGLPAGAEVIVPDCTFAATANAVIAAGGVPVLADVDPMDLANLHVQQVCEVTSPDHPDSPVGIAVLETLAIGPHAPSGFIGFDDGAR